MLSIAISSILVLGASLVVPCHSLGGSYYSSGTNGMMQQVCDAFRSSLLVPDVLSIPPTQLVNVQFGSNSVMLGNQMTPRSVANQPTVSWPTNGNNNQLYTLIFMDADAPGQFNSSLRSYMHWVVYNIRGSDLATGQTYAPFLGSLPGPGSGFHRYVFLVLPQRGSYSLTPIPLLPATTPDLNRVRFNVAAFSSQVGLGDPIAGNFYYAQPDDYSNGIYAG